MSDWNLTARMVSDYLTRSDDEVIKKIESDLPDYLGVVPMLSTRELLKRYVHHESSKSSTVNRRRIRAAHRLCAQIIRKEILNRADGVGL